MKNRMWVIGLICFALGLVEIVFPFQKELSNLTIYSLFIGVLLVSRIILTGDLANQYYRFLDYLPITRGERLLTRIVDSLTGIWFIVLPICWYRIVFFEQSQIEPLDYFIPSRLALLLGIASFAWWVIPAAVSLPFFNNRLSSAIMLLLPVLMILGGIVTFVKIVDVIPTPLDLAPALFASGCLMLAASVLNNGTCYRIRSRGWRWLAQGLIFVVAVGLSWGLLVKFNLPKRAPNLNIGYRVNELKPVNPANPGEGYWLEAICIGSGRHLYRLDPGSDQCQYVGRELQLPKAEDALTAGQDIVTRQDRYLDKGEDSSQYARISSDGKQVTNFQLEGNNKRPKRYSYTQIRLIPSTDLLCYTEVMEVTKTYFNHYQLVLADKEGKRQKVIKTGGSDYVIGTTGNILALAPWADDPDQRKPVNPYLLYNTKDQSEFRFKLPGLPKVVSPDLMKILCHQRTIENGRWRHRLLLVELPSLREIEVMSPEELQDGPVANQVSGDPDDPSLPDQDGHYPGLSGKQSELVANTARTKGILTLVNLQNNEFRQTIWLLDLQTGEKRLLMGDELPRLPLTQEESTDFYKNKVFGLFFLPTDQEIRYSINIEHYEKSLSGGPSKLIYKPKKAYEEDDLLFACPRCQFSDVRSQLAEMRLTLEIFDKTKADNGIGRLSSDYRDEVKPYDPRNKLLKAELLVYPDGQPRTIFSSPEVFNFSWHDETSLIVTTQKYVYLIQADGNGQKQIFPPANKPNDCLTTIKPL